MAWDMAWLQRNALYLLRARFGPGLRRFHLLLIYTAREESAIYNDNLPGGK